MSTLAPTATASPATAFLAKAKPVQGGAVPQLRDEPPVERTGLEPSGQEAVHATVPSVLPGPRPWRQLLTVLPEAVPGIEALLARLSVAKAAIRPLITPLAAHRPTTVPRAPETSARHAP